MKAIYTILNDKVFRIAQNTTVPADVTFQSPGVSTTAQVDPYEHTATEHIYISNFKKPGTKSNKELYNELVDFIKTKKITEINTLQNFFYIYVDYAIYEGTKEISHNAVMKPIEPIDKITPLGVATNNECVFRRVKTFNPTIELKVTNTLPFGITKQPNTNFNIKIHNVAIFEETMTPPCIQGSWNDCPLPIGSNSIQTALGTSIMVYSTQNAGVDIQMFNTKFTPNTIFFAFNIVLADYVCVYDKRNIDDLIVENIDQKYNPDDTTPITPPDCPCDPEHMIQDPDINPRADGDYDPDRDGYFDWYERCTPNNPNRLLVVEDRIPDGDYDVTTMIKKRRVICDIPDIEVGEYVLYRESLITV